MGLHYNSRTNNIVNDEGKPIVNATQPAQQPPAPLPTPDNQPLAKVAQVAARAAGNNVGTSPDGAQPMVAQPMPVSNAYARQRTGRNPGTTYAPPGYVIGRPGVIAPVPNIQPGTAAATLAQAPGAYQRFDQPATAQAPINPLAQMAQAPAPLTPEQGYALRQVGRSNTQQANANAFVQSIPSAQVAQSSPFTPLAPTVTADDVMNAPGQSLTGNGYTPEAAQAVNDAGGYAARQAAFQASYNADPNNHYARPPGGGYGAVGPAIADPARPMTVGAGQSAMFNGKTYGPGTSISMPDPRYGSQPMISQQLPDSAPSYIGTHGADASSVPSTSIAYDASKGEPTIDAPQNRQQQVAAAIAAYPKLAVEGSPENKRYVEAFKNGGMNNDGILDLAHTLFAPKTDAQAAAQQQDRQDAWADRDKTEAFNNQTPAQRQAVVDQGVSRMAALNNAPNPDDSFGGRVGNAVASMGPALVDNVTAPLKAFGGFMDNVYNGFTGNNGTPAPSPATPATAANPTAPAQPVQPAQPATPATPNPAYPDGTMPPNAQAAPSARDKAWTDFTAQAAPATPVVAPVATPGANAKDPFSDKAWLTNYNVTGGNSSTAPINPAPVAPVVDPENAKRRWSGR